MKIRIKTIDNKVETYLDLDIMDRLPLINSPDGIYIQENILTIKKERKTFIYPISNVVKITLTL